MQSNEFWWNVAIAEFTTWIDRMGAFGWTLIIVGVLAWFIPSLLLSRIFSKASQPAIAAFIPLWNVVVFYQIGGYSALWVLGSVLGVGGLFAIPMLGGTPANGAPVQPTGVELLIADLPFGSYANGLIVAFGGGAIGLFAIFILLFAAATSLVGLLAAYNIGRAFGRDAGLLIVGLLFPLIWLAYLAFTKRDFDTDLAHPRSTGYINERGANIRRNRAMAKVRADSRKGMKAREATDPGQVSLGRQLYGDDGAPIKGKFTPDEFEKSPLQFDSDDPSWNLEAEEKKSRKKKRKGDDPFDSFISDAGTAGENGAVDGKGWNG